jgi:hypothetical protein
VTRIGPLALAGLLATAGHTIGRGGGQAMGVPPALTSSHSHLLTRSPSDPAAARAGVEAALRGMAVAVLAGDADGYLAHVWKGEADWAKEQENWAADLKRHVPDKFEFELRGELALSDGWADGEARMSWRMAGGPRRSVDLPVRFAGNGGGWLYAGERWEVIEGDRVRVLFAGGFEGAAQVVADELPEVRARVPRTTLSVVCSR